MKTYKKVLIIMTLVAMILFTLGAQRGCEREEEKIIISDLSGHISHELFEGDITHISTNLSQVKENPFRTCLPISDNPDCFGIVSEYSPEYWVLSEEGYLYYNNQICNLIGTEILDSKNYFSWPTKDKQYYISHYKIQGDIVRDIFGDELRIPITPEASDLYCFYDPSPSQVPEFYNSIEGECCPPGDYCINDVNLMIEFPKERFTEAEQELISNAKHRIKDSCFQDKFDEQLVQDGLLGDLAFPGCVYEVDWFIEDPYLKELAETNGYETHTELVIPCFVGGTYLNVYCGEAKAECNCYFEGMEFKCG